MLKDDALVVLGAAVRLGPFVDKAANVIVGDDLTDLEARDKAAVSLRVSQPSPCVRALGMSMGIVSETEPEGRSAPDAGTPLARRD